MIQYRFGPMNKFWYKQTEKKERVPDGTLIQGCHIQPKIKRIYLAMSSLKKRGNCTKRFIFFQPFLKGRMATLDWQPAPVNRNQCKWYIPIFIALTTQWCFVKIKQHFYNLFLPGNKKWNIQLEIRTILLNSFQKHLELEQYFQEIVGTCQTIFFGVKIIFLGSYFNGETYFKDVI